MSLQAKRLKKLEHHLCACGHKALFIRPGWHDVVFREDHSLCFECYRATVNRERAARVARTRPLFLHWHAA
jgi:hypothetical protein